jgi:hypothetical protein
MDEAGSRCQCLGACGKAHANGEDRCLREHGTAQRLLVAPADPHALLWPAHKAATLPRQELAAWCPSCHDSARNRARRTAQETVPARAAEPDALF